MAKLKNVTLTPKPVYSKIKGNITVYMTIDTADRANIDSFDWKLYDKTGSGTPKESGNIKAPAGADLNIAIYIPVKTANKPDAADDVQISIVANASSANAGTYTSSGEVKSLVAFSGTHGNVNGAFVKIGTTTINFSKGTGGVFALDKPITITSADLTTLGVPAVGDFLDQIGTATITVEKGTLNTNNGFFSLTVSAALSTDIGPGLGAGISVEISYGG
jgi:hypothetical protein